MKRTHDNSLIYEHEDAVEPYRNIDLSTKEARDSLEVSIASDIKELEKKLQTAFLVDVPFLETIKIDLKFWLLYLPVLLILSEIYLLSIIRRFDVLVRHSPGPDHLSTVLYVSPFSSLIIFFKIIEGFILLLFVDQVARYALELPPALLIHQLCLYFLCSLFVIIHHIVQLLKLGDPLGYSSLTLAVLRLYMKCVRLFRKLRAGISIKVGNALLLSTLGLTMSKCLGPVKGYEFFTGKRQWNLTGSISLMRRTFDYQYTDKYMTILYIIMTIVALISIVYVFLPGQKKTKILRLFSGAMITGAVSLAVYCLWNLVHLGRFLDWPFISIAAITLLVLRQYVRNAKYRSGTRKWMVQTLSLALYVFPLWLVGTGIVFTYLFEIPGLMVYWGGLNLSILGYQIMIAKSDSFLVNK